MRKAVLALLTITGGLHAQSLTSLTGAVENQVFQRGAENKANINLTGTCAGWDGKNAVGSMVRGKIGAVLVMQKFATVNKGHFSLDFEGVTAGGPYSIEIRACGTDKTISNLLVGDLWVLAGQSNMEGVGDLIDVQPPDPLVHSFDQTDMWVVAEEPLHSLPDAADRVHWRKNAQGQLERLTGDAQKKYHDLRAKGAGLGLPFAVEMVKRTGVPVGLLPCAHGGTSMTQWDPALRDQGGDSLYGAMVRRVKAAGGNVAGLLWYQGESDANPTEAPLFAAKFENLIARTRADFHEPNLPFYYVQIGRFINDQNLKEWNAVQESQRELAAKISRTGVVAAVDFELDDGIHVNTQDHKRLAHRLANLATGTADTPEPVSAKFRDGVLRVSFAKVNGGLRSSGRISGFEIHNAAGANVPMIYKARIDPADATAVLLYIGGKMPEGAVLHYGYGKDPYCNLRDAEDMAVPVFGPMAITMLP